MSAIRPIDPPAVSYSSLSRRVPRSADAPEKAGETAAKTEPALDGDGRILAALARKWSVPQKEITGLYSRLQGEEKENFFKAAQGAESQLRTLVNTTMDLSNPKVFGSEARREYLETAAGLGDEDRRHFIRTIGTDGKSRESLIRMVGKLSENEEDLTHFLMAADAAGRDTRDFISQAEALLHDKKMDPESFTEYLKAAVKTGDDVARFVEGVSGIRTEKVVALAFLVNETLEGDDVTRLLSGMAGLDETERESVIAISSQLSDLDRGNFLKTLARAGKEKSLFLSEVEGIRAHPTPDTDMDLSDFLAITEKADNRLDMAMFHMDEINKEFAKGLSRFDMVNYLDAMNGHNKEMDAIVETAGMLSGKDRSLFLYAAAKSGDVKDLMAKVASGSGEERSAFLLSAANGGLGRDQTIYMKGLLGEDAYGDYRKVADTLTAPKVEELVALVEDLDGLGRNEMLQVAAKMGGDTEDMVSVMTSLTMQDQKTFLGMTQLLGEKESGGFVSAMEQVKSRSHEILSRARTFDGPLRVNFAQAISGAKSKDVKGFLEVFDYMSREEQSVFLIAADDTGKNLGDLVEMAHVTMQMNRSALTDSMAGVEMMKGKMIGFFIDTFL